MNTISVGKMAKVFLLENKNNYILIDTGIKKDRAIIEKFIKENIEDFSKLKLIVITHYHYDHTDNLRYINALTGAPILANENEKRNIENGEMDIPVGLTCFGRVMIKIMSKSSEEKRFESAMVNISINDDFSLKDYGFEGKIICTPGHTLGSVSIIIEKSAFVGDLFFNLPIINLFSVVPPIGKDLNSIKDSIAKLLEYDLEKIYPAHGKPFSYKKLVKTYKRIKNKMEINHEKTTR